MSSEKSPSAGEKSKSHGVFFKKILVFCLVSILPLLSKKKVIKILNIYGKISSGSSKKAVLGLKKTFEQSMAGDFMIRMAKLMNFRARGKMGVNLILDGFMLREAKRKAAEDRGGNVPFTVLISPTMRCNLRCQGCYAANYSKNDDLPYEVVDRLITEAEAIGVALITFLGGEPFMWEGIFKIMEEHPRMYFQIYTNASLINEEKVKRLKRLGNVILMFSVEGFKKETDARRGEGVFDRVMKAMDLMKKHRLPFGYSAAVTRENEPVITSDEFVDLMIEKGALIGWMFLYMPVGAKPDLNLMPTPEQRLHMLAFDKRVRKSKPIFVADFWNDAPFVGGCIAGKFYAHITSDGWVEPCIFSHVAQDNIKEKTLLEAMNSDFFRELRNRQPYNDNLYLPCMWIDTPKVSRELHQKFKLHLTHPGADDVLVKDELVAGIDKYSRRVSELYQKEWERDKTAFGFGASGRLNAKFGNDQK